MVATVSRSLAMAASSDRPIWPGSSREVRPLARVRSPVARPSQTSRTLPNDCTIARATSKPIATAMPRPTNKTRIDAVRLDR